MKNSKTRLAPNTKMLKTDNMGHGVRNPMGKIRDVFSVDKPKKLNTKKPPHSLA